MSESFHWIMPQCLQGQEASLCAFLIELLLPSAVTRQLQRFYSIVA